MRTLANLFAIALLTSASLCAEDFSEQHNASGMRDLKAIQGDWLIQKVVRGGQRLNTDTGQQSVNRFSGDKWFPGRNPDDYTRFTLNGDTVPKQIDMVARDGSKMLGIYRLNDDDLTLVFARPGEARPAKLESENGSPTYLMDFKRQEKD